MPQRTACFLAIFILCTFNLRASSGEEQELADTMLIQLVDFVEMTLDDMDPNQPGIVPRNDNHTHDPDPCYAMAYLYKTEHPLNPFQGDTRVRNAAIAICDFITSTKMRPEWPLYLVDQVYALLEEELPLDTRHAWKEYARDYVQTRGMRPYFFTSPNHEAWNALAIFRAGQVFNEPEWMNQGARLMQQLFKLQTELGYFDEGHHHGPAMKYNQVQLAPMLLYYDYSQDPLALDACKKLADFMIRYSFPDGSPISTFDGRQSYSFGYYGTLCYGLDRWPLGKELNRRIYRTRKKWDILTLDSPYYSFSEWYAYFGIFFMLDEYRSLQREAPSSPLPQDRNGYAVVEKSPSFDGGVVRQKNWMVAMSAHISDVPRYRRGPYQLDRQSRLDIWHEKTGLIIGGGHSMVGANPPLANFMLLTGYAGVTAEHGLMAGGDDLRRQSMYSPRAASTVLDPEIQILEVHFGHGDFFLETRPLDDGHLELSYRYDVVAASRACIQLPLILYHDSSVLVDEQPYDGTLPMRVRDQIRIKNPTMDSQLTITFQDPSNILLREAIYPLRWYGGDHKEQRFRPYYRIGLLSLQVDRPRKGKGTFLISVE